MMDLDDILNLQRVQCTGDIARAGWVIDQDAVIHACDILGIEMEVRIKFMTGKNTYGTHRVYPRYHKITLDQSRSMVSSNNTLWHELAHAMQAERYAKETNQRATTFYKEYSKAKGVWGHTYMLNKYEIEAREIADNNEHYNLLALAP